MLAESMSPPFAAELDRRVRRAMWCTMATVDPRGRPRTRLVHPWWEGSTTRVWEALARDPAPYGFDPAEIFEGGPGRPTFGLLRLDAWRIEPAGAPGEAGPPDPAVWRRRDGSRPAPPA